MSISYQARVVFPVDQAPIEQGVVTIDGERIAAVGREPGGGQRHDLGNVALLPGLVNAHTHLEFSHLRRPLGTSGNRLPDWIRLVIAERAQRSNATLESIASGVRESLQHGVTTLGEIAITVDPSCYNVADVTPFVEVIGFSRARAESAFAAAVAKADAVQQSLRARIGVSPHAPYTVSPRLLEQLVDWASRRNRPVAMHLAESEEELRFLATGRGELQQLLDERSMWDEAAIKPGTRPLDYLQLLAAAPRSLVIHGNYLDAEERAFLAAHRERMALVYCPRTHAFFEHRRYPLEELLAAGVRVALGTDSRASNPDLDLLAEMRHIARNFPAIHPADLLRLGTLAGARALGRDDEVGSITPGKLANLIVVPLANGLGASAAPDDCLASILAERIACADVWLRGRRWCSDS